MFGPMTRAAAQAYCETFGMSLLSIRSAQEQNFVQTNFPNSEFMWLSATERSGPWTWLGKFMWLSATERSGPWTWLGKFMWLSAT